MKWLTLALALAVPDPLHAAGRGCPAFAPEPNVPLVSPPALAQNGVVLGTYSGQFLKGKGLVLRLDEGGGVVWARELAGMGSGFDWAVATGDGSVLLTGGVKTAAGDGPAIVKFRLDGTLAWSKFLLGAGTAVWGFDGAADGGAYAAVSGGVGDRPETQTGVVLRLTQAGDVAWARTIAVGGAPVTQPVVAAQADGAIVAKGWNVSPNRHSAILLLKLTSDGDPSWTRLISVADRDLGVSNMLSQPDGSIVVVGYAGGSGPGGADSAIIHFARDGMPLSGSVLHAPPVGGFGLIARDHDGWFLLGGTTARGGAALSDPVGPSQPTVARVSATGEVAWAMAEDFGPKGGMLFGIAPGSTHVLAVGTRGDWGPATILRLRPDAAPDGDGWGVATPVQLSSSRLALKAEATVLELAPIRVSASDADLVATKASLKLAPLCRH